MLAVKRMFARVGERGYVLRDIGRGLVDPATYGIDPLTLLS